ncbi:glycosyltransferase family 2 protein [Candidatus Woesebacteria bacterium]|nr:glycosyltransferase family 2 protein [Candidatus Woesebacteria bacterium]
MKLSVIVPVYNEEKTVGKMLSKLIKVADVYEVIVVDDGSSDNSAKEINKIASKKIKLFSKSNGGKGSAIRLGLTNVSGSHVLIQDADLEYDPEDIPVLTEPIKKDKAEVVYGSRFLGPHLNLLYWHRVGNGLLNFLINIMFNTTLSDMETCYKLIPTEHLRAIKLQANAFDIEPEITCRLLKRGIRIYEVPISYVGRDHSQGKKITWVDGFAAVGVILRERLL